MRIAIATLIFCLICAGCSKSDEPQLPDITNTGARTFGCKVNGRLFVASGEPKTWDNIGVTYDFIADSSIYISASDGDETIWFRFFISDKTNEYYLKGRYPYIGSYSGSPSGSTSPIGNNEYHTDGTNTGKVKINNYDGKIISGTFCFTAANDTGVVAQITEGRFDIPRSSK